MFRPMPRQRLKSMRAINPSLSSKSVSQAPNQMSSTSLSLDEEDVTMSGPSVGVVSAPRMLPAAESTAAGTSLQQRPLARPRRPRLVDMADLGNMFVFLKGFGPERMQVQLTKAMQKSFMIKQRFTHWDVKVVEASSKPSDALAVQQYSAETKAATGGDSMDVDDDDERSRLQVYVPCDLFDLVLVCNYFEGDVPIEKIKKRLRDYLMLEFEQEMAQRQQIEARRKELITAPVLRDMVQLRCQEYVNKMVDPRYGIENSLTLVYVPSEHKCFTREDRELLDEVMMDAVGAQMASLNVECTCEIINDAASSSSFTAAATAAATSVAPLPAPPLPNMFLPQMGAPTIKLPAIVVHVAEAMISIWERIRKEAIEREEAKANRVRTEALDQDRKERVPRLAGCFWRRFVNFAAHSTQSGVFDSMQFAYRFTDNFESDDDQHDALYELLRTTVVDMFKASNMEKAQVDVDRILGKIMVSFGNCPSFWTFQKQQRDTRVKEEVELIVTQAFNSFSSSVSSVSSASSSSASSGDDGERAFRPTIWLEPPSLRDITDALKKKFESELKLNAAVSARFFKSELRIRVTRSGSARDSHEKKR